MRPAFATALALVLASPLQAQQFDRGPDTTIDAATRSRVIEGVLQRIEEGYVLPAKAGEMTQAVRERARRGEYDRIVSAHALADSLTAHLQGVSHDRHLRVVYRSQGVPDERPAADLRRRSGVSSWSSAGR
jgi:N-terminal domain of Peptidase_S41 in eukaryotic IRBP